MNKKQIVILGGGFGGLRAARLIDRALGRLRLQEKYGVTLIDRNPYHTYTPLLYEVATVPKGAPCISSLSSLSTYPFEELLRGTSIRFLQDEAITISLSDRVVSLKKETISFDCLILALGSEINNFSIPGVREYAYFLKTFEDALRIREALFREYAKTPRFTVLIGGAGPTGIELGGEIKNWLPDAQVRLLEAGSALLPRFHPAIRRSAAKRMRRLEVSVYYDSAIKEVRRKEVLLSDGRVLPYDIFLWTAGVKGAVMPEMPFGKMKGERIAIGEELLCIPQGEDLRTNENVYAIGDIGCPPVLEDGSPAPLLAQVALRQAEVVSKNIIERIRKNEGIISQPRIFAFKTQKEYSYVLPIGGKFAIAKVGPILVSGFFGWCLKGLVELRYLFSIMRPMPAFRTWIRGLRLFTANDRLG